MIRILGGCLRRVVSLVVLVGIALLAWNHRAELRSAWGQLRVAMAGAPEAPSRELAAAAHAKLATLSGDAPPERVILAEAELQSLVQYRYIDVLPEYVVAPTIRLERDRIHFRALIPTAAFPQMDELGEVIGFLPDTAEVAATGQLIPLDGDRVGLALDEVSAARVPLPRGLIPVMLQRMGRKNEPGLPPDALALPLPEGATAAYIRDDALVFVTGRTGRR